MNIYPVSFGFLQPYCDEYVDFVDDPGVADFVLMMNTGGAGCMDLLKFARQTADKYEIPFCFWTIEDPNAYLGFLAQAKVADYVFTSDGALLPQYRKDLGHNRVHWLPLAASEAYHRPLPLREDATDAVFSGNWYDSQWVARKWGVDTVILPLAEAGYSITTFSLDEPPYPILMQAPNRWIGPSDPLSPGYYSAVAQQYTFGKIVLGVNNQRSHMDGRGLTTMTSMRTPEALACGKPFLASQSDAYKALGLLDAGYYIMGVADTPEQTLSWVENMIDLDKPAGRSPSARAMAMGENGRHFVLEHHTYGRRMERIMACLQGDPGSETWE